MPDSPRRRSRPSGTGPETRIEVRAGLSGRTPVRNSRTPADPCLHIDASAWQAVLQQIR